MISDITNREGHVTIFLPIITIMHYLNVIMEKHQTDTNWGAFYKITDQYSSKVSETTTTKWDLWLDPGTEKLH